VFFAAHDTRGERQKTKAKIRSDLEGCLQEHRDVQVWRFITNDTLLGEIDQFVDNKLRHRCSMRWMRPRAFISGSGSPSLARAEERLHACPGG
jgi:hypothetical protein